MASEHILKKASTGRVSRRSRCRSHSYSRPMLDKLNALLERLKAHQRTIILAMAEHDGLPAGSALRQIAELENVIAAVEAVAGEEADRARRSGPAAREPRGG